MPLLCPRPAAGAAQNAVRQRAVGRLGGGAVAVDDLHFADDASIEMLLALAGARRPGWAPSLFAQRPGRSAARRRGVRTTRCTEAGSPAQRVAPGRPRLGGDGGDDRLAGASHGVDSAVLACRNWGATPHQPAVRAGDAQAASTTAAWRRANCRRPVSVGGLIERRIRHALASRALALARVAAIAGVDFGVALAEEVIGPARRAVPSAFDDSGRVLRDERIAHDLVVRRGAALDPAADRTPPARRRAPRMLGRHEGVARARGRRTGWPPRRIARAALARPRRAARAPACGAARSCACSTQAALIEERLGERAPAALTRTPSTLVSHASRSSPCDHRRGGTAGRRRALQRLAASPAQRAHSEDMRGA